jgi:hypothetical protein
LHFSEASDDIFFPTPDCVHTAKAQALWKSSKEKQHYESALSKAILMSQQSPLGCQSQGNENINILEQKRSQLKFQVQSELSLRDKALESHASIARSIYHDACARSQHQLADLRLQLPPIVISDAFEQDSELILKASQQLELLHENPAAVFCAVANMAPSFASQDAVFVAVCHAENNSGSFAKLHHRLIHFNKIKWIFDQFCDASNSTLPSMMSKSKFVKCIQRLGSLAAMEKLEEFYDTLCDSGQMSYHQFCCAFLFSESKVPDHEVQSIPLFNDLENMFHFRSTKSDFAHDPLQNSHSQVVQSL